MGLDIDYYMVKHDKIVETGDYATALDSDINEVLHEMDKVQFKSDSIWAHRLFLMYLEDHFHLPHVPFSDEEIIEQAREANSLEAPTVIITLDEWIEVLKKAKEKTHSGFASALSDIAAKAAHGGYTHILLDVSY